MFVYDIYNSRIVDDARAVELRRHGGGPERPDFFCLTVDGAQIGFEATDRGAESDDGTPLLLWTVAAVGHGIAAGSGQNIVSIPRHCFGDAADRSRICALIEEALPIFTRWTRGPLVSVRVIFAPALIA